MGTRKGSLGLKIFFLVAVANWIGVSAASATSYAHIAPSAAQTGPSSAQTASSAPSAVEKAIIERLSFPIAITDADMSGPGIDLLLRESADAQFVLLGEYISHVDHATPEFTALLFSALHKRHGFNYLAVEQDPFGMELVSSDPVRGHPDRIARSARRYPYAFTFINDEELRLFADVGRTASGGWKPVWGFDQAFGMTLPLEELVPLAPDQKTAAAAQSLLDEVRRNEVLVPDYGDWRGTRDFESGHLIARKSVEMLPRLDRLRALYNPTLGGRADTLLEGMKTSALIFSYYVRANERSPTGEPLGYFNGSVREQWMKDRFIAEYRHAEAADRRAPRVLVKAGSNHLSRNAPEAFTLGTMLHEFAITNGMRALSIAIFQIREDWPSYERMPRAMQALLPSRNMTGAALVDLRPLRAHLYGGVRFGLSDNSLSTLRTLVYDMDFVLFLPSRRGTFALTSSH